MCNNFVKANQNHMAREVTRWSKPTSDMLKLNVDGSYHGDEGEAATGAVIRDANGDFIAGSCSFITCALDATTM